MAPFVWPGVLNLYASPVAAAGRIYLTDQQGSTVVIDHQNPKPLALNTLDEGTNASFCNRRRGSHYQRDTTPILHTRN